VDQKGPTCLVKAIPHVLKEVPDARFLIVGEGPLQHKAMSMGKELGLESSLSFLGVLPMEDLIAAYNASWVVAVPSLWEGMPLVVLEAAACGRPVVASSVYGIPEAVEPGRTGVLVPPRDPKALAEGIVSILSDPARGRAMAEAALSKARAEFDLVTQVNRTVELYNRVVEADAG
jgi:glycosyltransferase involved in cell wall biosynthesis